MSIIERIHSHRPLYFDSSKFKIVEEEKKGFWNSILSFLNANTTHRLNIVTSEDRGASIAIRTAAPSIFARNWKELRISEGEGHRSIYVNVNSLAYRLHLNPDFITHVRSLEGYLDEHTKPLSRIAIPPIPTDSELPSAITINIPQHNAAIIKEFPEARWDEFANLAKMGNKSLTGIRTLEGEKRLYLTQINIAHAVSYVETNQQLLDNLLAEAIRRNPHQDHIVLRKADTGLNHSIEYRGPGKVLIRFHVDFAEGSSKKVSKALNPYTGDIITKGKMILSLNGASDEETKALANAYRTAMNNKRGTQKQPYRSMPTTAEKATQEAYLGQNVPGALKMLHFSLYSKEVKNEQGQVAGRIYKAAIYNLFQHGDIGNNPLREPVRQKQAALGIVENVAVMHRENLIHNDIKGLNIVWIVDENGFVRASTIDFGYARGAEDLTKYYAATYIPPEIITGSSDNIDTYPKDKKVLYNKAKDAYALGMTLLIDVYKVNVPWERDLLFFRGNNPGPRRLRNALIKQMLDPANNLDLPERIPPEMRHVIMELLNPKPEKRMTSNEAQTYLLKYYAANPGEHPYRRPRNVA